MRSRGRADLQCITPNVRVAASSTEQIPPLEQTMQIKHPLGCAKSYGCCRWQLQTHTAIRSRESILIWGEEDGCAVYPAIHACLHQNPRPHHDGLLAFLTLVPAGVPPLLHRHFWSRARRISTTIGLTFATTEKGCFSA